MIGLFFMAAILLIFIVWIAFSVILAKIFSKKIPMLTRFPISVFLVVLSIALTGIYTLFANKYLDKEQEECIDELRENGLIDELVEGKISHNVCKG